METRLLDREAQRRNKTQPDDDTRPDRVLVSWSWFEGRQNRGRWDRCRAKDGEEGDASEWG